MIFSKIDKQVLLAINEADLILFMVDIIDGLTGSDQSICKLIKNHINLFFLLQIRLIILAK